MCLCVLLLVPKLAALFYTTSTLALCARLRCAALDWHLLRWFHHVSDPATRSPTMLSVKLTFALMDGFQVGWTIVVRFLFDANFFPIAEKKNADTSTSVTVKVKKAVVIRCRLYVGTRYDVYGFNTLQDITICFFYVICTLIIRFILCSMFVPKMKFVGSVEFEIWTFVWRKLKWRHFDFLTNLIFMKFKYKSTKGISKQHIKFQFDQT